VLAVYVYEAKLGRLKAENPAVHNYSIVASLAVNDLTSTSCIKVQDQSIGTNYMYM